MVGALFIHRLDGQLAAHLPASGAGHLSAAQVSAITPQGLAHLPAPLRHVIASAFASALPPIYAYLIPLLAAAFLLALILKEIPLRTAARLDASQALTGHPARVGAPQPPARHAPPAHPIGPQAAAAPSSRGRSHRGRGPPACPPAPARITRPPGEPPASTIRISN